MTSGYSSASVLNGEWSIRGRMGELAELERSITAPASGAIVTGPSGIGLTTLLGLVADGCDPREFDVVELRGEPRTATAQLAAFAAIAPLGLTDATQLADRMAVILAALRQRAGNRRTLLLIDDADALDGASIEVACRLVESGAGAVVAALRQMSPAASGLARLWRAGRLSLVKPHALTEAEVSEIVEGEVGGTLAVPAARHIREASAGRPGFVRPIVLDALEMGALRNHAGVWVCERHDFAVPRLGRLVRAWLAGQPAGVQRLVRYVSLAAYLPISVLDNLVGRDAVVAAEEAGWIRVEPDGRVRVEVPATSAATLHAMDAVTRRSLRTEIVRAWQPRDDLASEDELQIVLIARDSDSPPSPEQLSRAAHLAARRFQTDLVGELASKALADEPSLADLALTANAHMLSSATPGPELAVLAQQATSDRTKVTAVFEQYVRILWIAGDCGAATQLASLMLGAVTEPEAIGELNAMRAASAALDWKLCDARDWVQRAMAQPSTDLTLISAGQASLATYMATGEFIEGAPSVAETEAALDRQPARLTSLCAWFGQLSACCLVHGSPRDLQGIIDRWRAREPASPSSAGLALTSTLLGDKDLMTGRARTAIQHYLQALVVLDDDSADVWRERSAGRLALAYAVAGDLDAAREQLSRTGVTQDPSRISLQLARVAGYWIAAREAGPAEASRLALDDAEQYRRLGAIGPEALALQYAIRFGDTSRVERITHLAATHDIPRASLAAAAARALVDQDAEALAVAASDAVQYQMTFVALDIQSHAALLLKDRGDRVAFWENLAKARRLRELCETDTPPWLAARQPLPLTSREEEVARLAANGLSNVEVAQRLVISPRTVEGHLQRVFDKLGVHDRRGLRDTLGSRALER